MWPFNRKPIENTSQSKTRPPRCQHAHPLAQALTVLVLGRYPAHGDAVGRRRHHVDCLRWGRRRSDPGAEQRLPRGNAVAREGPRRDTHLFFVSGALSEIKRQMLLLFNKHSVIDLQPNIPLRPFERWGLAGEPPQHSILWPNIPRRHSRGA